ncbi:protein-tyrosine sulfotransferase-like isoform X3 [Mangifera indica]|uniref:protein-tyrosine sulfotransferase-like isoform X3 n=1 Tax=Mangifera indica TaxID=29780 RepID=UPI001CFAA5CC|nr:protein-tyrosine sulfotransferase-like isoform X3 [Mangifera indica]
MSTRSRYSIQFCSDSSRIQPMDTALKFGLLLLLLGFVNASTKNDFRQCERTVKNWALSSLDQEVKEDKHTLQDLLFFLHVPRTGGRTYFHCLLKKLYYNSLECPRSYDKLRFDPSKTKCRLLATHDDYSMISKLPKVKTSGVSTLDIWPWKYLVPWMREDLFTRRDVRKQKATVEVNGNDSYNMEDFVMPLQDFINNPTSQDIVHNGATFQVVGLTNNSYLAEAHEVRHCVLKFKTLGDFVLQVAKKRLDEMLYVGLTENHRESANIFGNVVGAQVISQMVASKSSIKGNNKSEHSSSISDPEPDNNYHQNSTSDQRSVEITEKVKTIKDNMTVGKLMQDYEACISSLRSSQATRRINSLKRISPVNFSKEARLQVPEEVLQQIRSLNSLDLELYKYALDIFEKQKQKLPSTDKVGSYGLDGKLESMFNHSHGITFWLGLLLCTSIFLLIFFFLFVNARRTTSKVKI